MKISSAVVLSLFLAVPAPAQDTIRKEPVHFAAGKSAATIQASIRGYEAVDYQLDAKPGQLMTVILEPSNPSAYFNVVPPGTAEAIFIGSTQGNRFEGLTPTAGLYTIRVYLMRNAARRNEVAKYTLDVAIRGGSGAGGDPKAGTGSP